MIRNSETRIEDIRIDPPSGGIDSGAKTAIMPLNPKDRGLTSALRQRFPELRAKAKGSVMVFEN